ncbi:uncharacterized protein LOC117303875 [Asterias rubens]|uniref:uncharacterized protein LOC117303875 n=1 Tax=Asterias rubens TaxID=7604 RepID=UPI001455C117|nr:uncharacterized protein LOC117303875 [Asterias rubens]
MAISIQSTTNCVTSVVVILLMAVDLANGVYIRERKKYPTRDYADDDGTQTSSLSRHQKTQNISTELVPPSRREPFRRILVLCNYDNECDRKSFCHGGEGHKSCLPCRRSRRRCQRNGMCCHGYVCQQGRCVPKERRYDTSFAKASQSYDDEGSISQHTKDNMRKRREDEVCDSADQCGDGLCCAQHFWTRICKPILVEGDVCTKRRDRYSDVFQRCHCGGSLSCKRHPVPDERYHTCQNVKGGKRLEGYDEEIHEGLGAVLTLMKDTQESAPKIGVQTHGENTYVELFTPETDIVQSDKRVDTIEYGSETQSQFKESMESVWKATDEDRQIQDQLISSKPTDTSLVGADESVRTEPEGIAVL